MPSPTQWTWVWVDSRSWWWTGRPDVLRFMGSQRVRHDWLNWTEMNYYSSIHISVGCSLWFSFYTSEASPEWSNLIYWLKLPCASLKMYCRDLFSFQGYMSNNLLVFLFIQISYRSFSRQTHCHVFPRYSYSQLLSYLFFSFLFSFSLKKIVTLL